MTRACLSLVSNRVEWKSFSLALPRHCTVHFHDPIASLTRSIHPVPLNVLQLTSHQPQPIETIIQLTFQTANNFPFDKEAKFSRKKNFSSARHNMKIFSTQRGRRKSAEGANRWDRGFSHSFLSHCIEMENIKSFILYSCFVFTIKEKPKKPFIEPHKTNIKVGKNHKISQKFEMIRRRFLAVLGQVELRGIFFCFNVERKWTLDSFNVISHSSVKLSHCSYWERLQVWMTSWDVEAMAIDIKVIRNVIRFYANSSENSNLTRSILTLLSDPALVPIQSERRHGR